MTRRPIHFLVLAFIMVVTTRSFAADAIDTKLLSEPAMSAAHTAFIYAGDLWLAPRDGGTATRLTAHKGRESNPRFSPDGRSLAFSAEYDGNTDVYLISVDGGEPKRLTWHPGPDVVRDFSPDGQSVLFSSARSVHTRRYQQLFTVSVAGDFPQRLPIPNAFKAAFSPDGKRIAYTPLAERFLQWKHYRGGTTSRIWVFDRASEEIVEVPQPASRCNDTDPMWVDDVLYFRSDRSGEFNLFSWTGEGGVEQVTHHNDFPILNASAGDGGVIYEREGSLFAWTKGDAAGTRIPVSVGADLVEARPRWERGAQFIRDFSVSPTGARVAFEYRGEILTVPATHGDPRNITDSPGSHERAPAWSPDGRHIAYFSDDSGEYELHIAAQSGEGDQRRFQLDGSGFYHNPRWSPDGEKVAYWDSSLSLYWLDVASGGITKVGAERQYTPLRNFHHRWSHDSRWITYTLTTDAYFQQVFVHSLETGASTAVTDGLSEASEPVFDPSGKFLYFTVSTDAGPLKHWFAMSNNDKPLTNAIYVAVLQKKQPSPLKKQSDEEPLAEPEDSSDEDVPPVSFEIDFDGLDQRILALPLPEARYTDLEAPVSGELYFIERPVATFINGDGDNTLKRFRFSDRQTEALTTGLSEFALTRDGEKVLVHSGQSWAMVSSKGPVESGKGLLPVDALEVRVEPRAEWRQIFREAWRINRDYFYAPNMHGADWDAMGEKYEAFLPHLTNRDDLNRLIQWMCSELAVGHHRVGGGDEREEADQVTGGLLGADFRIEENRYRFAKVFGGLNWNPDLRSPLTEPGVEVETGEYLLEVGGRPIDASENLFARFENTADKIVSITVGPSPDGEGARTVDVVPVGSEASLRNRDWVEGNLKKVNEATNGRVAYVYVPNTAGLGHEYFKRYFFPQAHKDAIIVDERYNGGGQIADYYIDMLRRPQISFWATRHGEDLVTPSAAIHGPKVMLIDETAGSGGDMLPWMFRKLQLGKLIGRRTWGGLVGTLGFPVLMDGGVVTAPDLAIWTEDGWIVENVGVPPDIEVEQLPKEVNAGHDPQLDKAIEVILEELEAFDKTRPQRPPYPVRTNGARP